MYNKNSNKNLKILIYIGFYNIVKLNKTINLLNTKSTCWTSQQLFEIDNGGRGDFSHNNNNNYKWLFT